MSNDLRDEHLPASSESAEGPLRPFRVGRRAVLQSLAGGVGAAVFASRAPAHEHLAQATMPGNPEKNATAESTLQFFERHDFDTLATLSEQIVPGSRAAQVPEFLD